MGFLQSFFKLCADFDVKVIFLKGYFYRQGKVSIKAQHFRCKCLILYHREVVLSLFYSYLHISKGACSLAVLSHPERQPSNPNYTEKKCWALGFSIDYCVIIFGGYGEESSPWRCGHSPLFKASKLSCGVVWPRLGYFWPWIHSEMSWPKNTSHR